MLIGIHNLGACDKKGSLVSIPRYREERVGPNGELYGPMNNRETVPHIVVTHKRKSDLIDVENWHSTERGKWSQIKKNK
ncbi:MAG: hypothetical protein ACI9WL_000537 [Rubritalea sp.]